MKMIYMIYLLLYLIIMITVCLFIYLIYLFKSMMKFNNIKEKILSGYNLNSFSGLGIPFSLQFFLYLLDFMELLLLLLRYY